MVAIRARTGLWAAAMVAIALAMAVAFIMTGPPVGADELEEDVSGSFSDTALDLVDGDNAANLISGVTDEGVHYEGVWEIELTGPSQACGGAIGGSIDAYSIIRRYDDGDLLYSALDPANPSVACFNPGTGAGSLTINAVIIGGTGSFDGASGSYTAEYDVQLLVEDPAGGIAHGSFTGTVEGDSGDDDDGDDD